MKIVTELVQHQIKATLLEQKVSMHRKNDPKYKTEHQHNQQLKAQLILCQLFKVHSAHCFVFQKARKFITSQVS